jgi:acetyl esterase/lipase
MRSPMFSCQRLDLTTPLARAAGWIVRWMARSDLRAGRRTPLIVFLHGGFWRAAYDRKHTGPLAEALSANGFAVCTPEYRKVGQPGGAWPGTFEDVAAAVMLLPGAIAEATGGLVDASRFVLAGHSAGGHLALWAAAEVRARVLKGLTVAVVSLAGVCDLADCYRRGLGNGAAGELMGGGPEQFPGRYAEADPMRRLPIGAAIGLVHGTADDRVPWEQSQQFAVAAATAGDQADCVLLEGSGHFELIDPLTAAWPAVLAAFTAAAERLE